MLDYFEIENLSEKQILERYDDIIEYNNYITKGITTTFLFDCGVTATYSFPSTSSTCATYSRGWRLSQSALDSHDCSRSYVDANLNLHFVAGSCKSCNKAENEHPAGGTIIKCVDN